MTRNFIDNIFEKISTPTFFLILIVYQVLFIFQGFEMSDEGFFLTLYDQIYTNPETVQYNFPFWFSGVIGGAIDYIFPNTGIWGFRFAGVLITTGTILLSYHLLKKYLNKNYLKLGLLLVTIFISNNAKELQYNNLSAFFYLLIAFLLFRGIRDNKIWLIFLAGAVVSVNTFTRFPNILGIGFITGIIYHGFITGTSVKTHIQRCLVFIGGFVATTALIIVIMKLAGHWDIYINSLKTLFGMVTEEKGSRGKNISNYNSSRLIQLFFTDYAKAIAYAACVIVLLTCTLVAINYIEKKTFYKRWMVTFPKYLALLMIIAFTFTKTVDYIVLLYFLTGLSLIAALLILISDNIEIKILSFLGCFILLVFPLGSSEGIRMVEPYALWLPFPIIINYLFNITSINTNFSISSKTTPYNIYLTATPEKLNSARNFVLIATIFMCLYFSYHYPFFDRQNRVDMRFGINNKKAWGVYTSKGRANAMNDLLDEASKYIKPGDYLLAYDCMPMLNYLTDTRPYIHNAYPWLYAAPVFKKELDDAVARTKELPVIIEQKIKTIGDGSDWPQTPLRIDEEWQKINEPRNNIFNEFLANNNYKEVWSSDIFRILIPPRK
jgi:hypothetical protein